MNTQLNVARFFFSTLSVLLIYSNVYKALYTKLAAHLGECVHCMDNSVYSPLLTGISCKEHSVLSTHCITVHILYTGQEDVGRM